MPLIALRLIDINWDCSEQSGLSGVPNYVALIFIHRKALLGMYFQLFMPSGLVTLDLGSPSRLLE